MSAKSSKTTDTYFFLVRFYKSFQFRNAGTIGNSKLKINLIQCTSTGRNRFGPFYGAVVYNQGSFCVLEGFSCLMVNLALLVAISHNLQNEECKASVCSQALGKLISSWGCTVSLISTQLLSVSLILQVWMKTTDRKILSGSNSSLLQRESFLKSINRNIAYQALLKRFTSNS